jgi:peroxiredoxin
MAGKTVRRRRPWRVALLAGSLILIMVPAALLAFAGLRPASSQIPAVASPGPAARFNPPNDSARPPAPDFAVDTVDGGRFVLSEHRGRAVVVYFMAGWCLSCVPEARALARLYAEYRDRGLEVLAVDAQFDETPADLDRFRRLVGASPPPDYRWAIDRELKVVSALGVRSLDTTIVIDPEGRVAYRDEVPTPYEVLRRVVEGVLP